MINEKKISIDDITYIKKYLTRRTINKYINNNEKIKNILEDATPFLSNDVTFAERVWYIINDTKTIPLCVNCLTEKCKWLKAQKYRKYDDYCPTCFKSLKISYKRINEQCFQLYGMSIEDKKRQTIKEKYGTESVFVSKNFKTKRKNTLLEKYGVESPMHCPKINEKYKNTFIEKYGKDNPFKIKQFIDKKHRVLIENHGTWNIMTLPKIRQKMQQTIKDKYDVENISKNRETKRKKYEKHLLFHNVSAKFNYLEDSIYDKIENLDWLIDQQHNQKKTLLQISNETGYSQSRIAQAFKRNGIIVHQIYKSLAEKEILDFICANRFDAYSTRATIYPYELDIYIPDKNIAIEYCGLYWHGENQQKPNYHKVKYELCKQKRIRLIQIFEDEWTYSKKLIKEKLFHILGISQERKIYARKCEIKTLTQHEKQEFFNKTHIQGDGPSSCNYGLFFDNMLVAAMGFIKQANNEYILNRYSTNANVVGGFTKLLTYFEKVAMPKKITTFADLRWSQGNLYEKSEFSLDKILKPDYSYVIGNERIHKFNFRHKQMKTKLKNYDENLSEHENMLNNKIYRIYDAGKLRFIKKYE